MKALSKAELQEILVEMLDKLVAYIEKNNLRYYLVGGTLLGAVRHKGFIPWDDDIDIGMPRSDYRKLIELAQKEPISEELVLLSDIKGNFSNPFSELINKRVVLEKNTSEFIREKYQINNLFIDIIPQDGWPEDEKEFENHLKRAASLRYSIQNSRAILGKGTTKKRALAKIPLILRARMSGNKKLLEKMERLATSFDYDESKYVGAVTYGIYGKGERNSRESTLSFEKLEFEGKYYKVPGCYKEYLAGIYGDYMTLPPEEKRYDHRMKAWLVDK